VEAGATAALAPEPAPVKNSRPFIQDLVIFDVNLKIAEDIEERKQFGLKKYGTALQAFNGRNPIVDAYQEVLDGIIYLKQAAEEARESNLKLTYEEARESNLKLTYRDILYEYKSLIKVAVKIREMLP
jgi:hypothetical protein